jgi:hypothetical protein
MDCLSLSDWCRQIGLDKAKTGIIGGKPKQKDEYRVKMTLTKVRGKRIIELINPQ